MSQITGLIDDGYITEVYVCTATGIDPRDLQAFLTEGSSMSSGMMSTAANLSPEQGSRLSTLAAQLAWVTGIDDDARLRGILESLISECQLTIQNLAL